MLFVKKPVGKKVKDNIEDKLYITMRESIIYFLFKNEDQLFLKL